MNAPVKPVAWSFSSLQKFLNCPKRYYHERVLKDVKRHDTESSLFGERGHKAIELSLQTKQPPAGEFAAYAPIAERLQHIKGTLYTEQKFAINTSLKPVKWFAPDVWCRGILDALWIEDNVAKIVDHKFGKRKKSSEQLKLFALLIFAHHKEVERVNTAFVWMVNGKMDVEKFNRRDVPILWNDLLPDVRRLEYAHKTNTFVPKPSGLCSYCPVKSCSFWKSEDGGRG